MNCSTLFLELKALHENAQVGGEESWVLDFAEQSFDLQISGVELFRKYSRKI